MAGGNLAEAHRRFKQATAADPSHAASWVSWGKLEERFRRPWRARQCYAKATDVDESNYYAWQVCVCARARACVGAGAFRRQMVNNTGATISPCSV
jgi:hypothetical protein